MTEAMMRQKLSHGLRKLGFTVFNTSDNRPSKNTRGTPDLFVTHPTWHGAYCAIDTKAGGKARRSAEQQYYEDKGMIYYANSVEEGINYVLNFAVSIRQ